MGKGTGIGQKRVHGQGQRQCQGHGQGQNKGQGGTRARTVGRATGESRGNSADTRTYLQPLREGLALTRFRQLLTDLGMPAYWAELTTGNSWRKYRALDAYLRVRGSGIASPKQEARCVVTQVI